MEEAKDDERIEYKIYQIVCNETYEVYIGKTTRTLEQRLWNHKCCIDCTSKKIIEKDNYYIEKIDSTFDKEESIRLEGFYIKNTDNCINRITPGRTKQEYRKTHKVEISEKRKEYYKKNKDEISEKSKEYREVHKNEIKEKRKETYTCECDSNIRKDDKARHERSQKHIKYINSLI